MSSHIGHLETATAQPGSGPARTTARFVERYQAVRKMTEGLARPLSPEDCQIQSMPDASPVKWHLAHTTWFFETFVLAPHVGGFEAFHPSFVYLFNSYYNSVGDRLARPRRGLITRPTLEEVYAYRAAIDRALEAYLEKAGESLPAAVASVIELGLNHEQQHQELILTDLKHAWAANPLHPVYREALLEDGAPPRDSWLPFPAGLAWIGHEGGGFAFDNESPRHRTWLHAFQLASRLVTNADYLAFIRDGGYARAELWLSDGWAVRQA
jgi:ergothioneine biosynthesis protein EgtB